MATGGRVTALEPSPSDSNLHVSGTRRSKEGRKEGGESLSGGFSESTRVEFVQIQQTLNMQLALSAKQHL